MASFAYTILYVLDVAQSIQFYEQVFGLEQKFISPEGDYGEIVSGSTTLAFAQHELAMSNLPDGYQKSSISEKAFGIELAFTTANVEQLYEKAIHHGATAVHPAKVKPWGQTVAYVRDPNGFLLEICTPMS